MLPKVTALRCVRIASRGQPSTSLRLCGSRVCQKYRTKLRRELRPACSRRSFAKFLSIFRSSVSSLRRMVCTKCGAVGAGRAADASYVFLALERNAVGCPPAGAESDASRTVYLLRIAHSGTASAAMTRVWLPSKTPFIFARICLQIRRSGLSSVGFVSSEPPTTTASCRGNR